jgi:hypothetical protein
MNTKDTVPALKRRFLSYELGLLSVKAALSTRDKNWPIYSESTKQHQRGTVQDAIRSVLVGLETRYGGNTPTETQHVQFIQDSSDILSRDLNVFLFKGRFRVGVMQKLINLHLKYLWVAGVIPEPPHCPLDGIVRDLSKLNYDWTTSDSIEEYKSAIAALRKFALPRSLSEWELCEFRRRAQ